MKNKETLELFKIYLNQTFKKNENQRSIHDDGHDNSGGHPDYHNDSHDNITGIINGIMFHDDGHDNSGGHPDYHNDSHDNVTSELRINLVKHETNKHFG